MTDRTEHIHGGYVLLARLTTESTLWSLGPDALRLALWLIMQAHHSVKPKKYHGFQVSRGELITSLAGLVEATEWHENRVTRQWSREKVRRLIQKLVDIGFMEVLRDTYGTHVRLCNYDSYQTPDNYNSHSDETTPRQHRDNTETTPCTYNKGENDKNEKTQEASGGPSPSVCESSLTITDEAKRLGELFCDTFQTINSRPLAPTMQPYAALLCAKAINAGMDTGMMQTALEWLTTAHGRKGVPVIRNPNMLKPEWFESVKHAKDRAESERQPARGLAPGQKLVSSTQPSFPSDL